MSFYRIYRPTVIDGIDNVAVRDALLRLLSKPKTALPHAYLLSGPRGAGKTTSARVIAKLFNCTKPGDHGPCGTCEQCASIALGNNMDVLELDGASNRGIDEIRSIKDGISLSPVMGAYRIYIIDEVHMLTTEAFNALLKTLEEPPGHAVFVLATTDPQKVPVTIQSRCMQIMFQKATDAELLAALTRIVKEESLDIDSDALSLIVSSVDGSFRDAVKNLEIVSFSGGHISVDSVRSLLAIGDDARSDALITALREKQMQVALSVIGDASQAGQDMRIFITNCLKKLESLLVARVSGSDSTKWSVVDLTGAISLLSRAFHETKGAAISHLPIELAVIEYCLPKEEVRPLPVSRAQTNDSADVKGKSENSQPFPPEDKKIAHPKIPSVAANSHGALTMEKLQNHWSDVIVELKKHNHSVSGVMRSTRPKSIENGIVTIEAFFSFHKEKLAEPTTRELISSVMYSLFGEKVKVDIVLGKK